MTATIRTIDDVDVSGKHVLVRVDFNVPLRGGKIIDDRRIVASLPTLRTLSQRKAKVIVVTHVGRPKGHGDPSLSTRILAERLEQLLGKPVAWCPDIVGPDARRMCGEMHDGNIVMLENVRFDPREEENDPVFAAELASLADLWCMDAFGTAHRAHASTEGVGRILPGCAGYLMARELEVLGGVFENPHVPVVAIIGGAKVSSKVGVINHLLDKVDVIWIGGAMASTFARAQGHATGISLVEEDRVDQARTMLAQTGHRATLKIPSDVVISAKTQQDAPTEVVDVAHIPADKAVVDVGPQTIANMEKDIASAGTVIWNGPLGVYEIDDYAQGTRAIALAVGSSSATTVIGGGDVVAAIEAAGIADQITHVSTGGGATLEFLEGKTLPAVAVLERQETVVQ